MAAYVLTEYGSAALEKWPTRAGTPSTVLGTPSMTDYESAALEPVATDDSTDTEHHDLAPDGGIIVAGDGAELLDEDTDDVADVQEARPDDCQCWDDAQGLPCWPCYRAGFENPNPETPGASDDGGA